MGEIDGSRPPGATPLGAAVTRCERDFRARMRSTEKPPRRGLVDSLARREVYAAMNLGEPRCG